MIRDKISEKKAIELLKKYSTNKRVFQIVLSHSKAVQKIALRFGRKIKNADTDFIKCASLLHDIGRFICPPGKLSIFHGIIGAEILKKEGLSKRYQNVCMNHLGAGISKKDIIQQKLELPKKNYIPKTIEEKIITVADNLVFGKKIGTIEMVYKRYKREINESVAKRAVELHNEVFNLMNK
jgi:uncharacterized protein (TIGR00295 family)